MRYPNFFQQSSIVSKSFPMTLFSINKVSFMVVRFSSKAHGISIVPKYRGLVV